MAKINQFIKAECYLLFYFGGMVSLYSLLSVFRHWHFQSSALDLGLHDQMIWYYSCFKTPTCTLTPAFENLSSMLGDHFDPIEALAAPLFWVFPHVEALLILQSFLLMLPLFPLFFFTQIRLGRRAAYFFCGAYSVYWGIQLTANFDFHEVSFAVPLIAFALYFMDLERWKSFSICAILLMLVKEDMCLLVSFLGLHLVLRRHFARGLFWSIFGFAVFYAEIKFVIPFFKGSPGYGYWFYPQLGPGPLEALKNCLVHPWIVPLTLFSNKTKIETILVTYAPFSFLSLLSPLSILTLPSICERMLSNQPDFWELRAHHYCAVLSLIIAMSAGDGLFLLLKNFSSETERKKWLGFFCAFILVLNLATVPVAPLRKLFNPSYYRLTTDDLTGDQAIGLIPGDSSVLAQQTIVPHLSHRKIIRLMDPDSISREREDYVIACRYLYCGPLADFGQVEQCLRLREKKGYQKIFDQNGWIVLKRAGVK
jgi:uncharacterized membrane protein